MLLGQLIQEIPQAVSVHDRGHIHERQTNPMICDPVLHELPELDLSVDENSVRT